MTYNTKSLEDLYLFEASKSYEEKIIYYFIENGIFRLVSLWDTLYQLINVLEKIGLKIDDVSYWKVRKEIKKIDLYELLLKYKSEEDDTDCGNTWRGNNRYLYDLRNEAGHRFAISNSVFSKQATCLKDPPSYILKRIGEDYNFLVNYTRKLLNKKITSIISESKLKNYED